LVSVSRHHSEVSFSSHVPALFHADPTLPDSRRSTGCGAEEGAGEEMALGAMSPMRALASSVRSLLKKDVLGGGEGGEGGGGSEREREKSEG
jgi:hypothetical protein